MVNKNLFDITEALNINGLDLVATAGGGEDYSVSLEQLALEVEKELLRPFLLDKIGHFMIDITNRFNGALEAQDNYFKYIKAGAAADGSNSGGWVFPEPYPLLQGKVSAFLDNRGVEYLAIGSPNGIPAGLPIADRTIRQVNANETVGVLQEDDIKSHTHGMNHDHDMSHQHQYYTYA
ncbi:MAG: hypothetical protein LBQ34_02950, partial [Alphaproteobacteria bacterium]|nr:hypothetical protein [Alphaproteobacteria bacterium]